MSNHAGRGVGAGVEPEPPLALGAGPDRPGVAVGSGVGVARGVGLGVAGGAALAVGVGVRGGVGRAVAVPAGASMVAASAWFDPVEGCDASGGSLSPPELHADATMAAIVNVAIACVHRRRPHMART